MPNMIRILSKRSRFMTMIFSIFLFFCRFQIVVSGPNIVLANHRSMESLLIQLADDEYISVIKCTLMPGFVVQGHK